MTPHLNRLIETVQMKGHNICSYDLTKIIPNCHQILPLIWRYFLQYLHKADSISDFESHYSIPECDDNYNRTAEQIIQNLTSSDSLRDCERDVSLLYLLLLLGTLWVGTTLYNFTKT